MPKITKDKVETVKGIVEAVPIYDDLLQPAVQELGRGLHTLSKTIHIALAPVSALVWSYDQIRDFITSTLEQKLKDVPKEKIIPPDPSIAGPTLEALRYAGHKEELRELFANLLATSMNSDVSSTAHPAFVEIIKQLNSDEAKILSYIKGSHFPILHVFSQKNGSRSPVMMNFSDISFKSQCNLPDKIHSYLDNLNRLGLIRLANEGSLTDKSVYSDLENHPIIKHSVLLADTLGKSQIIQSHAQSTMFGISFYESCIKS